MRSAYAVILFLFWLVIVWSVPCFQWVSGHFFKKSMRPQRTPEFMLLFYSLSPFLFCADTKQSNELFGCFQMTVDRRKIFRSTIASIKHYCFFFQEICLHWNNFFGVSQNSQYSLVKQNLFAESRCKINFIQLLQNEYTE